MIFNKVILNFKKKLHLYKIKMLAFPQIFKKIDNKTYIEEKRISKHKSDLM